MRRRTAGNRYNLQAVGINYCVCSFTDSGLLGAWALLAQSCCVRNFNGQWASLPPRYKRDSTIPPPGSCTIHYNSDTSRYLMATLNLSEIAKTKKGKKCDFYMREGNFYGTRVQKSGHAQDTCPTRARWCPDFWTRKFSCPTRIRAVFVSDTQNTGHGGI